MLEVKADGYLKKGTTMSDDLKLSSPWITFARKIYKMFELDPEVKVEWNDELCALKLYVESQEKADALDKILPDKKVFGNVDMHITVVPANIEDEPIFKTFEKAFKGNPAVSYTETLSMIGNEMNFIVFEPKVVQYYNDNIGDINGIESTLYQDIAKEIFDEHPSVYFCTDIEDQSFLGRPLGEWP